AGPCELDPFAERVRDPDAGLGFARPGAQAGPYLVGEPRAVRRDRVPVDEAARILAANERAPIARRLVERLQGFVIAQDDDLALPEDRWKLFGLDRGARAGIRADGRVARVRQGRPSQSEHERRVDRDSGDP